MPGASIGCDLHARRSRILARGGLCVAIIACGLVLGRIFSLWTMLACGVGIAIGALLDRSVLSAIRPRV
jgi:predicted ABC-type sugar transport system permease subunit